MRTTANVDKVMNRLKEEIQERIDEGVKEVLVEVANTAVSISPVRTGAYVTSFSFAVGEGTRSNSSNGTSAKSVNKASARQEGLSLLLSDINKIKDFSAKKRIALRNNSPHAVNVEHGEGWKRDGYKVFSKIRNMYG
tara:strand:+ start:1958 stop:2368 length:411 start_codon:yes stop_codon:yes gene_type:complete